MIDTAELVSRYVALWNEADPERRREAIAGLWAKEAVHRTRSLEARGHEALEQRIGDAHARFVRPGDFSFAPAGDVDGHHDGVKFHWQMVRTLDGAVVSVGFDFLLLDGDGRIRADYQFIEQ